MSEGKTMNFINQAEFARKNGFTPQYVSRLIKVKNVQPKAMCGKLEFFDEEDLVNMMKSRPCGWPPEKKKKTLDILKDHIQILERENNSLKTELSDIQQFISHCEAVQLTVDGSITRHNLHGYLHRAGGPAVLCGTSEIKEYWHYGTFVRSVRKDGTQLKHAGGKKFTLSYPDGSVLTLAIEVGGPSSVIYDKDLPVVSKSLRFYQHSFKDQPSLVTANGLKQWHRFGKLHREEGPAYIDEKNGVVKHFIHGEEIRK